MANLIKKDIKNIIGEKYLSYAISTIISRSLPDLRDGLKPVHRRIIYSMYELNLKNNSQFKKCARIVGDVMGKFHPHGDQAIYDSLVRMSQDFSIRYPLIEGQGNFGNIDGDNAAAMRYTEARLDINANSLLEGLDQNAVDFIDNYDGQNKEPSVLPALLPNIILNGSSGIAVGMATNIPPHNLNEVIKGLVELINNNNITYKKILKIIKGPDFPTGGEVLINQENLFNIYNKGKGNFLIKSKWKKIELGKGLYNIEIYEIPYQVNKNRIIENIANLVKNKKIPIEDVWDESDESIRIILKPKNRNIKPNILMDVLFNHTDLSVKYHCNFNVLVNGKIPRLLGLKEILLNFIDHRRLVVKRISIFKIDKIKIRLEIITGLLIAYKNIEKIIKIIRKSKEPKSELRKKFKLSEIQATSILDMKLRSLRIIDEKYLINEKKELQKDLLFLNKLIKSKNELNKYLINQFNSYLEKQDTINLKRKTNIELSDQVETITSSLDDFNEIENLTLVCSVKDNLKIYKGHISLENEKFNEDEKIKYSINIKSNDKIIFFTNDGKLYTLNPNILPSGKSKGNNFSLYVNLKGSSKIVGLAKHTKDTNYLIVSKKAKGFIFKLHDDPKIQKNGKQIFNLKKDDVIVRIISDLKQYLAVVNSINKLLIFKTQEIPILIKSGGVLLQKIKNGSLTDIQTLEKNEGLKWKIGNQIRHEQDIKHWIGKRAQVGKKVPKRFNKDMKFSI